MNDSQHKPVEISPVAAAIASNQPGRINPTPMMAPGADRLPKHIKEGFTPDKPVTPGLYMVICGELNYIPDYAAITADGDILYVHDENLGVTNLEFYHNGLTGIHWKLIA